MRNPFVPRDHNAAEIAKAFAILETCSIGNTISDQYFKEVIREDFDPIGYNIRRAILRMEKEHGAVFSRVRGVGWMRRETRTVPDMITSNFRSMRKKAIKSSKTIERVIAKDNGAEPQTLRKLNQQHATANLSAHMLKEKSVNSVPMPDAPMPPAKDNSISKFLTKR